MVWPSPEGPRGARIPTAATPAHRAIGYRNRAVARRTVTRRFRALDAWVLLAAVAAGGSVHDALQSARAERPFESCRSCRQPRAHAPDLSGRVLGTHSTPRSRAIASASRLAGGLNPPLRRHLAISSSSAASGRLRRPPASKMSIASSAAKASSRSARYSWRAVGNNRSSSVSALCHSPNMTSARIGLPSERLALTMDASGDYLSVELRTAGLQAATQVWRYYASGFRDLLDFSAGSSRTGVDGMDNGPGNRWKAS